MSLLLCLVADSRYQIILFVTLRASFPAVAERHGEFFDIPTDPIIMVASGLFMAILTYSLEVVDRLRCSSMLGSWLRCWVGKTSCSH